MITIPAIVLAALTGDAEAQLVITESQANLKGIFKLKCKKSKSYLTCPLNQGCIWNPLPSLVRKGDSSWRGTCDKDDSPTPENITTIGGPADGQACVFPFRYYFNDKVESCIATKVSSEGKGRAWCSTNREYSALSETWGYCPAFDCRQGKNLANCKCITKKAGSKECTADEDCIPDAKKKKDICKFRSASSPADVFLPFVVTIAASIYFY